MLFYCWVSVVDAGPPLKQHWFTLASFSSRVVTERFCVQSYSHTSATTGHRYYGGLKLSLRLRRWPNIKPTMTPSLEAAGIPTRCWAIADLKLGLRLKQMTQYCPIVHHWNCHGWYHSMPNPHTKTIDILSLVYKRQTNCVSVSAQCWATVTDSGPMLFIREQSGKPSQYPEDTRHWHSVWPMLGHRLRRWPNIDQTLANVWCLLGNSTMGKTSSCWQYLQERTQTMADTRVISHPHGKFFLSLYTDLSAMPQRSVLWLVFTSFDSFTSSADPIHWLNVDFILEQCLQRWINIKSKVGQRLLFMDNKSILLSNVIYKLSSVIIVNATY